MPPRLVGGNGLAEIGLSSWHLQPLQTASEHGGKLVIGDSVGWCTAVGQFFIVSFSHVGQFLLFYPVACWQHWHLCQREDSRRLPQPPLPYAGL